MSYCPKCGKKPRISAIHGKIRTMSCLNCNQGWKAGINGTTNYRKTIEIEFDDLVRALVITAFDGSKVRLAAIN